MSKDKRLAHIKREFSLRNKKNPTYSMRKFARDAGFTQAYFSLLFSGKRSLSLDSYVKICQKLQIASESFASTAPVKSAPLRKKSKMGAYTSAEFIQLNAEDFRLQWFDLMIADFSLLPEFRSDVKWVSKTLGLRLDDVIESFGRLTDIGLLELRGEHYVKVKKKVHFKTEKSLSLVREYHRNMIRLASDELKNVSDASFKKRYISGASFTVPKKDVQTIKLKCENFIEELIDEASQYKAPDSLYQINLQLFPLANI